MKAILLVTLLSALLVGCGMSHEEYEERIEYCESRGLGVKVYVMRWGTVDKIRCVGEDGTVFSSRRGANEHQQ